MENAVNNHAYQCPLRVGFESHEVRSIRCTSSRTDAGVEEGACGVDGSLEVFCQPSIAPDPGEEPFDDPMARVYGEADRHINPVRIRGVVAACR
jgi:hypothetical protein